MYCNQAQNGDDLPFSALAKLPLGDERCLGAPSEIVAAPPLHFLPTSSRLVAVHMQIMIGSVITMTGPAMM
jgi:hypothetical protein